MDTTLLDVQNLSKQYRYRRGLMGPVAGAVRAVDGISFSLRKGETMGLVGESGCGKTTAARCILRLVEPTSGEIRFLEQDLLALRGNELRRMRRHMQMIFQDPYASLNPRLTAHAIIEEPLIIHRTGTRNERHERVAHLMRQVGLDPSHRNRYPHEFSGGQRQRIGIARALALDPQLIVADEPVSALDVSVQAQIINLLQELQESHRLTYLFIAHDLSVVQHFSDRIGVMYLGKLVELAPSRALFSEPRHPYTRMLLESVPVPDPAARKTRKLLKGELPAPVESPSGCRFHPRCPVAEARCKTEEPLLREIATGHQAACHLAEMQPAKL